MVDPPQAAARKHNSSGSTGSDWTHHDSSPSSISNYSLTLEVGMMAAGYMPPSHQMALGLNSAMVAGFSAVCSVPASTSAIQAAFMAGCDYPSFSQFDLHKMHPLPKEDFKEDSKDELLQGLPISHSAITRTLAAAPVNPSSSLFSLGRTMNVPQQSHEGFEGYAGYYE